MVFDFNNEEIQEIAIVTLLTAFGCALSVNQAASMNVACDMACKIANNCGRYILNSTLAGAAFGTAAGFACGLFSIQQDRENKKREEEKKSQERWYKQRFHTQCK